MGHADIPTGEHQVFDIFGVECTVGQTVRLIKRDDHGGDVGAGVFLHAERIVIVQRPAAECDLILKMTAGDNVLFSYGYAADVPAGFPLTGQESDPFQLPVFHAVVAAVLDVVPDSVNVCQQAVPHLLGVLNDVEVAAELAPPQVASAGADVVIPDLGVDAGAVVPAERFIGGEFCGKIGRERFERCMVLRAAKSGGMNLTG